MGEIIVLLILWFYVVFQLLVWVGFLTVKLRKPHLNHFPKVAVLVPARNEEEQIGPCLESLLALDYPTDKIEIWVGDDGSEDRTAEIIKGYSDRFPRIHYYLVNGNLGSARAKGNVLAQLVAETKAEYLFVTDADITVAKNWIRNLLIWLCEETVGMVSGTTLVDGQASLAKWQGLEWTLGNGYLIGLDRLGIKSTAVGNNMAFTRTAYQATGGYENMPFSVTEDFQLFRAIRRKGFETVNLMDRGSLNHSSAQDKLGKLLHQRKRWMLGAQQLPWYWILIFGLQAAFYPALFVLFFVNWNLALQVWFVKYLLQTLFLFRIQIRLGHPIKFFILLSYEAYSILMHLLMILFYLLPIKMDWKGRKY